MRTRNFLVILLAIAVSPLWLAAQSLQVNSANPNAAPQGTINLDVAIGGSGFKHGAQSQWFVSGTTNPGGVTVNSTTFVNSNQLTANITVADTATIASFDITVRNSDGRTGKGTGLFSVVSNGNSPICALTPLPSKFSLVTTLNNNVPAYSQGFGVSMRLRHVVLGGKDVLVAAVGSGGSGKLEVFILDALSGAVLDATNIGSNTVPQPHITKSMTVPGGSTVGARSMAMGDVNADGVPDIVIGNTSNGVALAFVGQIDANGILSYSDQIQLTVSGSTSNYGFSVAMGDLDGVAGDEIVVGDSGFGSGHKAVPARAFVFHFNATMQTFSTVATFSGGGAVAVGDVTGDSNNDLIVGNGATITVYPGPVLSASPPPSILSDSNVRVLAANVDGGAYTDVVNIMGAAAEVFSGPIFGGETASIVMSAQSGFTAGWGTGFDAGDINGDGLADVLIGAPNTSPSTACPANVGTAYIYLSNSLNPSQPARFRIEPPTPNADFGGYGFGVAAAPASPIFLVGENGRNINGVVGAGQVYVYKVN